MTIFQDKIKEFGIEVVEAHAPVQDPNQFIEFTRGLLGVEGFVICWDNGQRVKCKAEDYLRKHKAKDSMAREKNVIELIVSEKIDDVKAFLEGDDLTRVEAFEKQFWEGVLRTSYDLMNMRDMARRCGLDADRKMYAVEFVKKQDAKYAPFLFKMFEQMKVGEVFAMLKGAIAKSCGTQSKVDEVRWMFNCSWTAQPLVDD